MSGRPTAEMVADLHVLGQGGGTNVTWIREAADRLAELDGHLASRIVESCELRKRLAEITTLLPPCPTCGGKGEIGGASHFAPRCPDCIDGKVPIERLVKVFEAVHNSATWVHHSRDEAEIVLRGIR